MLRLGLRLGAATPLRRRAPAAPAGVELIADPELNSDAGWALPLGHTIADSLLTCTGSIATSTHAGSGAYSEGDTLDYEIVCTERSGLNIVVVGGAAISPTITAPGTYTGTVTANAVNSVFSVRVTSSGNVLKLDRISVIKR